MRQQSWGRAASVAAIVAVCTLASARSNAPVAGAATVRRLVSDYQTTFTGDVPAGVICTETETARGAGWGNVCFPIHDGESSVMVVIADTRVANVGARVEFGFRSDQATRVIATAAMCTRATLPVPPGANELRLYFGVVNSGAGGPCAAPAPGIEGTVTAEFTGP